MPQEKTVEGYITSCKHVKGNAKKDGRPYDFFTGEFVLADTKETKEYSSDVELPVSIFKVVEVALGEPKKLSITRIVL